MLRNRKASTWLIVCGGVELACLDEKTKCVVKECVPPNCIGGKIYVYNCPLLLLVSLSLAAQSRANENHRNETEFSHSLLGGGEN